MSPEPPPTMSLRQARRTALRAAGLHRERPARQAPPGLRDVTGVVDRLAVLQIDSVNVLARAHLLPLYSRLGPFDPALLDRAAGQPPRRLVEAWAHQASYVTPQTYRLLGWRHRAYRREAWGSIRDVPLDHAPVVEEVRAMLAGEGALTSRQVHARLAHEHPSRDDGWGWNWTVAKRVLEFLFFTGQVGSAGRTASFERRYDLVERVLPPAVLAAPEPDEADAVRELVACSVRALGVGTLRCVADYFRLRTEPTALALAELAEAGVVEPVHVVGWGPAWRHTAAVVPRTSTARALLSPFDPLVWQRQRLEALFGLRYRIEIYTPAAQRTWGYYVLPFLLGEHIAALVDLKADRRDGVLRVLAAHRAPLGPDHGGAIGDVPAALADELELMAGWLGLGAVVVGEGRDAAAAASSAVLGARIAAELAR